MDAGFFEGQGFSVIADECGLIVEGIDVGGTAVHEEKNDAFGAWSESGDLAGEWMGGFAGGSGLERGEEAEEGEISKAGAGIAEHLATGGGFGKCVEHEIIRGR